MTPNGAQVHRWLLIINPVRTVDAESPNMPPACNPYMAAVSFLLLRGTLCSRI